MADDEQNRWLSTVVDTLSGLFGGASCIRASGYWKTDQGNLVSETVVIVYSWADDLSIAQLQLVRQLAVALKLALSQQSVAVEIDGALFLV
jgi:hypothetical protein